MAQVLAVVLGLVWLLHCEPAAAQTCSASASTMAFGTVYVVNNTAYTTTSTVSVTCTGSGTATTLRICPALGSGTYGAGPNGPRVLGFNQARLDFDVFISAGYATRYPNDTSDATTPVTLLAVPASGTNSTSIILYGRIPAGQSGGATGTYSATLDSGISYGDASAYSDCASATARAQATFSVQATATSAANCTLSTTAVAFGIAASLTTRVDASGAVGVTCSAGANYSIALDGGLYGGTSATTRKMGSGTKRITYGLFSDVGRTQGWFTDAASMIAGNGTGGLQTIPIYGRVPVQTTPTAGSYADTVTVTLSY